ncbi:LysR substrate-binding domain-containing protein [Rhizobium viscosum]|uniref:LysR family nitrogen assimilation transcriptional regulator n=1 Tax=Rhizobium viscosum TaxID=1673 RepID=A0ABR9IZH8_RHIVS|nr:LysR family transcriptional regulator [Rhizobium viscosum]MBE1508622.1 LysR family nitrogen assimilation transcriptional regulator [Rhizobium viscosum]
MNLAAWHYLIRVAEQGSLSNAAAVLGVTQSALSRSVRDMEAELDVPIFHRNGRGVSLTEDGKIVLEAARSVAAIVSDLCSTLEANNGTDTKEITVGLLPSTAKLLAVPLMTKLREDFPGTRMQIVEGSTGHLVEWLTDGRLDLAVTNVSTAIRRFNPEPVVSHNLHLAAARDGPQLGPRIPFRELASYPLVIQSRSHSTRREIDHIAAEQGVRLNIAVEADSLTAISQLVSGGLAYGLIPHFAVDLHTMQSAMVIEPSIERTICLATPVAGARGKGLRHMISCFRTEIRDVYKQFAEQAGDGLGS